MEIREFDVLCKEILSIDEISLPLKEHFLSVLFDLMETYNEGVIWS